jgi:hypothetical protein
MNVSIFASLIIRLLDKGEEDIHAHHSFAILRVYLFWVTMYSFLVGFGFMKDGPSNAIISALSPYGSFTITYLLLGNFVFLLLFVPLWNGCLKKHVLQLDFP